MATLPNKLLDNKSRDEWRTWLAEHYASDNEVWLIMYKKHTGRSSVSYEEAVEEALCFGWIDSLTRSLDADRWVQKFGPRRPKSNWSESNKRRVRALIASGRMTEAGLAVVTFPLDEAENR